MPYKDPVKQREYQRVWHNARRVGWLEGKTCVRCGSTKSLQVDHIDPSTKVDHKIWSWSDERRTNELAKCQVLCWPCHIIKTGLERLRPHGTEGRYGHGCRCTECRAAHSTRQKEYRLRKLVLMAQAGE